MCLRPAGVLLSSLFADKPNSSLDLIRIRITFFDEAHRQSVRAENLMNAGAVCEVPQNRTDSLHERLNIKRIVVELTDSALRRATFWLPIDAPPLLEAAKSCGIRELRVERKEHDLIQRRGLAQRLDGFFGHWMPVAHGDDGDGINLAR